MPQNLRENAAGDVVRSKLAVIYHISVAGTTRHGRISIKANDDLAVRGCTIVHGGCHCLSGVLQFSTSGVQGDVGPRLCAGETEDAILQ